MFSYRLLGLVTWLLTAIGSIHLGLMGLGINMWASDMVMNRMPWIVQPAHYVIGAAGVVSLLMLLMSLSKKDFCCK